MFLFISTVQLAFDYKIFLSEGYFFNNDTTKKKHIILSDSLKSSDTTKTISAKDTLRPIFRESFSNKSAAGRTLTKKEFYKTDYRYTGNILLQLPFSFLQDPGYTGQPAEFTLYGLGYGNIAYQKDGVLMNNRWQNAFDNYHIQSETIDSIEIMSITNGFLFNIYNNPVTVNFVEKDIVSLKPYSRIKFYQASYEESMIDVIYSAYVFDKTNITVQLTNSSIDEPTSTKNFNNEFSNWQLNAKIKYLLSNSVNLSGSYRYIKSEVELNGGYENNSDLYEDRTADALYPERFQRTTEHDFRLNVLANFVSDWKSDFSIYYKFNSNIFKQDKKSASSFIPTIVDTNDYKVYGLNAVQEVKFSVLTTNLLLSAEKIDYQTQILKGKKEQFYFSAAVISKLNLTANILQSLYAKYLLVDENNYFGLGSDVRIHISNNFSLFGGASYFEKPLSVIGKELLLVDSPINKQKISSIETGFRFVNKSLDLRLNYFYHHNNNFLLPVRAVSADSILTNEVGSFEAASYTQNGLNLLVQIKLWKILLASNANYFMNSSINDKLSLPDFTFNGGLYYIDTLFNSNLYMKGGLNFKFTGSKTFAAIDYERYRSMVYAYDSEILNTKFVGNEIVPYSYQLDLFIAGTIQKKAIVYFVFENILDRKYYIVPYYPMYRRGLRFGISWEFLD